MRGFIGRLVQWVRYSFGVNWVPEGHEKFVIVFLSRTGSNLLAAKLSTHPGILCHHELFNPEGIHRALRLKDSPLSFGSMEERDRDPWAFAARAYAYAGGARAVGFKLSLGQANGLLLSLLLCRRVKKVVLQRRQLLETYASRELATRTGKWSEHRVNGKAPSQQPGVPQPVEVDPQAFARFVRQRQIFYAIVRMILTFTLQRSVWLDYEDLGEPGRLRPLLDWLGVEPDVALGEQTVKQNPFPLSKRIANYPALRARLAGSRYERHCP